MKKNEIKKNESPDAIPMDNIGEEINIGDWYWVEFEDEEWDDDKEENVVVGTHEELMCVEHVGSNFVTFQHYKILSYSDSNQANLSGADVHFDEFFECTKPEPNWKNILQNKTKEIQENIDSKIKQLAHKAMDLNLIDTKDSVPTSEEMLPSIYVNSPDEYKNQLIKAKDETFPIVTKEIEKLNGELVAQTRNLYLPSILQMNKLKEQIEVVEDRIFTVELYVGVNEQVRQIKKGRPAKVEEPISIRQMLLYMDEECLFDYKSGGMDFTSLDKFDKWIVKKNNLERILPEARGIVALQVRRKDKDYGDAETIWEAWVHMLNNEENKNSYLLIRNGANVYRIATAINFSPRLIPKEGELMSKNAFIKEDRWSSYTGKDKKKEIITPNHIEYDKHLSKEMKRIKKYNRIMLILQGLIDRTNIFDPMLKIKLSKQEVVDKWVRIIRDEENVLEDLSISWEKYRDNLNKTLKKGKVVYGAVEYYKKTNKEEYGVGDYRRDRRIYGRRQKHGYQSCPYDFSIVKKTKRDRSAVEVTFPWGETNWKYDSYDGWVAPYESDRKCHLWVPTEYVINVTDYNLDDYKMLLCNRHLHGKYLQWAPYLLSAEDYKRGKLKGYRVEESS